MCTKEDPFHISSTASVSMTRNDKHKGTRGSEVCSYGTIKVDIRNASIRLCRRGVTGDQINPEKNKVMYPVLI